MQLKLFAVRDKNYERIEGAFCSPSAGLAIRDNANFLARVSPHFRDDMELLEIGTFSEDGKSFSPLEVPEIHSWDEWKQPEVKAIPLTEDQQRELRATQEFAQNR